MSENSNRVTVSASKKKKKKKKKRFSLNGVLDPRNLLVITQNKKKQQQKTMNKYLQKFP